MRHTAPPHHLEQLADKNPQETMAQEVAAILATEKDWESLSLHAQATALAHVKVYLDDFISIIEGGPTERRQMTRHVFFAIDELF